MGQDYYSILGVSHDVTPVELKKAYKRMAIRYHPDKNRQDPQKAEELFKKVAEAFDVLNDDDKRRIYDAYGEEGLKGDSGGGGSGGHNGYGYEFSRSAQEMFRSFFSGQFKRQRSFDRPADPFGVFFDSRTGDGAFPDVAFDGFGANKFPRHEDGGKHDTTLDDSLPESRHFRSSGRRKHVVSYNLMCTLEEIYTGCTKQVCIQRQSITQSRPQDLTLDIEVEPGTVVGTKKKFPGQGNEVEPGVFQDIQIVIGEKKHEFYARDGLDLLLHRSVPLVDALTGFTTEVVTLDGRTLRVEVDSMDPQHCSKVVQGEGMPSTHDTTTRGDLVITCEIFYPQLNGEQKAALRKILPREVVIE